jgi:hypothetical protein
MRNSGMEEARIGSFETDPPGFLPSWIPDKVI